MHYPTKCFRIRLRPNSLERVKEWATALNESRRDEALATLREETVIVEAAFLETTAEGDFLVYVMKAEDFDKSKQSAATSAHTIDEYHRQFKKDAWDSVVELEMLVDLDRIAELDEHVTGKRGGSSTLIG